MMNRLKNSGFTLIEIAIVLIIFTILLGYTMAMVPVQQDLKQYRQADVEMERIIESLYAFAQVNGYLPCPAWADDLVAPTDTSDGFECRDIDGTAENCDGGTPATDTCDIWYGFVPGKTLGIVGKYSAIGLLLDPWGMPYRYQVTNTDNEDNDNDGDGTSIGDGDGVADFTIPGGTAPGTVMNLGLLVPDLEICTINPSNNATDTSCTNAASTVVSEIPAVILSLGKDAGNIASNIQGENTDNTGDGTTDTVYVKSTRSDVSNAEFDDLVKWVSPNILYSKMIEAGQLP